MIDQDLWWSKIVLCPHCLNSMGDIESGNHSCFDRPIQVRAGRVYDLAKHHYYWNHLTEEQMAPLLEMANVSGWQQALDEHYRPRVDDYTYAYATDERRADWFPLCDVPGNPLVLDVGAGWGAVTLSLARRGARVIALDSNSDTLEFIAIKALAEGLADRVVTVRVDPLEIVQLPVPDGCADLVVMNGVLEWVGPATEQESPEKLQKRVLTDVHRTLKDSGQLYVGIESRFSVENFRGARDHSGLSYTAILPRSLASVITKRAGKGSYRTYTHSYRAWHRIFESCGYSGVRMYAAMPDYRFPHRLIPIDSARVFRAAFGGAGISRKHHWVMRCLSYLGLHRDAVGHYAMVVLR